MILHDDVKAALIQKILEQPTDANDMALGSGSLTYFQLMLIVIALTSLLLLPSLIFLHLRD